MVTELIGHRDKACEDKKAQGACFDSARWPYRQGMWGQESSGACFDLAQWPYRQRMWGQESSGGMFWPSLRPTKTRKLQVKHRALFKDYSEMNERSAYFFDKSSSIHGLAVSYLSSWTTTETCNHVKLDQVSYEQVEICTICHLQPGIWYQLNSSLIHIQLAPECLSTAFIQSSVQNTQL